MNCNTNGRNRLRVFTATQKPIIAFLVFLFGIALLFLPQAKAATGCSLSSSFVTKSGDMQVAGTVIYQIAAKNIGNAACSSASVSVYYATNETFSSSSPKATRGYYWKLGTIAPGAETDIALTTNRSTGLAAEDSPDEACLSANNATDSCSDAAPITVTITPPTPSSTKKQELGLWDWDTPSTVSAAAMQNAVNSAAANGVTAIYLSIDDYLTIDALPAGAAKTQQLTTYQNEVATFLADAEQKNISVDAEAGAQDWAEPQNLWKPADIMNFVASFNATHPNKFRGVQYDVEPYLLPAYATDPATVLTQYVTLAESLVNQDKAKGLPLGLVIPSFYDDIIQWTPMITVDGITAYPYNHLLRLLKQIPSSSLQIMAYRNFASGTNSTIDISQTEVHEADGTGVTVIVGQETGNVQPSYVTFYGETKTQLLAQMAIIKQSYASNNSFGGMAIDYLEPFLALK